MHYILIAFIALTKRRLKQFKMNIDLGSASQKHNSNNRITNGQSNIKETNTSKYFLFPAKHKKKKFLHSDSLYNVGNIVKILIYLLNMFYL